MYLATIFLIWHVSNLNKSTIRLVTRIQTIETSRVSAEIELVTENYEQSSEASYLPAEVHIPRKVTLFRVVMERKLGIDWEHS